MHSEMTTEIITIAGALGAGKSSTAKRLASELEYRHFSSGDMFRQIAKERGLSIEQINKTAELEVAIDHDVDAWLRKLGEDTKLVIDSRLAYHWIPNSFKVYLNVDSRVAVERIFAQIQSTGRESQKAQSIEELTAATDARKEMERSRYAQLYQIDTTDLTPFDLVIDTTNHPLDEVVQIILDKFRVR